LNNKAWNFRRNGKI